jgi:hypothetical protein
MAVEQAVAEPAQPRTRIRVRTLALSPELRIAGWWVASRGIVLVSVAILEWIKKPNGYFTGREFASIPALLTTWDGRWYTQVASHGYLLIPGHQSDPAFFPLYPILLRFGDKLGLSAAGAGILISNLVLLAGLLIFYRLGRQFLPERDAYRASVFAALAPMGFTFSMVYPESVVFAAMALAGLAALRGHWLTCATAAAVATLARPQGALIVIPVAAAVIRAWPRLEPKARGLAAGALAAPVAALLAYPIYLGDVLGDPHAWSKAQEAWGRSFRWDGFVDAFGQLPARNGTDHWIMRDALFCGAFVLLLAVAWRARVPRGWIAMGALMVLLPIETGSFISVARFGVLALPVFWGLAVLGRRPVVDWSLRIVSASLLVFLTLTIALIFP